MFPTHPDYHDSMANDTGKGVITMTFDADMIFGYRCANLWFKWNEPEVAGRMTANFLLAGYGNTFARGFAIRTSQG